MNGVGASDSIAAPEAELAVNRWIIGEVVETLAKLNRAFDELRYDEMADAIYHFVFDTFCDWYVELIKNTFDDETTRVAAWAFDQMLVMLHPLMPFITEELWNANERPYELIVAKWPEPNAQKDAEPASEIEWLINTIDGIRSARAEVGVPPSARLTANVAEPDSATLTITPKYHAQIRRLARIDTFVYELPKTDFVLNVVANNQTFALNVEGIVDLGAERGRLSKALGAAEKERDSLAQRLANPNFTERAKPEAVEKARADHEAKTAEAERLRAALKRLG